MTGHVLIAGCGDLGVRIGLQMVSVGWRVTGLRRQPEALPREIEPLAADLGQSKSLRVIPGDIDAVVFCPTARGANPEAYREVYVAGLRNLFQSLSGTACSRLVLVSSTSVYAQADGSWVDETSPVKPRRFNGQVMLEAEELAMASTLATSVVRLSGIYGPGRERLLDGVQSGQARSQSMPVYWTNRIHQDDAAGMVRHILDLDQPDSLYIGTDQLPVPQHELVAWLAEGLGVSAPGNVQGQSANKRLSCQKVLDSGFEFAYPGFKAGYQEIIDHRFSLIDPASH